MRKVVLGITCAFAIASTATAQIFTSKTTQVSFFSETPVENISAENKVATILLNSSNNEVAVRVPVKSFIFDKALMQEHFNENYMESNKYPVSTFKGIIAEKIDYAKDGVYTVTVKGKMEMHGVVREENIAGTLTVKGTEITLVAQFNVKPADYNIEVPKLVFEKIAESILVRVNGTLAPYVKK